MKRLSHSLIGPLLLLLMVIAAAVAAVKFSADQAVAAQRKLTAQQAQLREAQSRVQKSGAEKELIARYLPDYRKLGALGFVGDEQRSRLPGHSEAAGLCHRATPSGTGR